ncbi:hypothetical protein NKH18_03650 [Streptomyces sp. M10(2022)]
MTADGLALVLTGVMVPSVPWPTALMALQVAAQLLLNAYRELYRRSLSPPRLPSCPHS